MVKLCGGSVMATRCNIVVSDAYGKELWYYRHYDGYPDSVIPSLEPLMKALREGKVRDNVGQFSGWLIVIGNKEYNKTRSINGWKCGAYEPTTGQHGDIDYLYHINLKTKMLNYKKL